MYFQRKSNRSFTTKIAIVLFIVLLITQGLGLILFVLSMHDTLVDFLDEKTMFFIILYNGILLAIVIFTVAVFFNRNIKKPLSEISNAVNRIKDDNLEFKVPPSHCPEITLLTDAINSLVTQFRKTAYKLFSTARNVTMSIKHTDQIISNISEKTNNHLSSAEELISALKNAGKFQKKILNSTHNLSEFSEENASSLLEINSATEEITNSSGQLFQTSEDIYSAISEMADSAKVIAKNTQDLSISTEQTSTSISEITANLKEVEKSSKESAALTLRVREIASGIGMGSVTDAINGMEDIASSVVKNQELVKVLGAKSEEIERILSIIAQITKQTNLLSLNAAILALQAGEHGKGFSVVANEIKSLADGTASSAKEIRGIVETLQAGITSVKSAAEECLELSENGTVLVMKTGEAFREVINIAHNSADLAEIIQKATEEQVSGVTHLNDSMEMLRLIVEQAMKTSQKQERGSEYMLGIAEKIKEISTVIKRGMEEQNTGIHMITKNLELTNDKIKHVTDATSEQEKTNERLLHSVNKIKTICNNTITITQQMRTSFKTLYQEAETLIKDLEGFKLE